MPRPVTYLSAIFIGLTLVGCSSGLSRGKAAEVISNRLQAAPNKTIQVYMSTNGLVNEEELQQEPGDLGVLVRLGYFGCEMVPEYIDQGPQVFKLNRKAHCRVVFTEKGRKESVNWEVRPPSGGPGSVTITVAKPELVEVTGVTQKDNEATVIYTWRMRPLNEIGEALDKKEVLRGVLEFRKFDDGWRFLR